MTGRLRQLFRKWFTRPKPVIRTVSVRPDGRLVYRDNGVVVGISVERAEVNRWYRAEVGVEDGKPYARLMETPTRGGTP